jgi:hypothetical protein
MQRISCVEICPDRNNYEQIIIAYSWLPIISFGELINVLKHSKNNKTPGEDGIQWSSLNTLERISYTGASIS